jgi:HD-GYP domain-containing protein (c-di-GMP phosphodiesterase class II)
VAGVFRLLALLGGLSVATDMGAGAPLEESLKRCLVAQRLAREAGCTDTEVADVVYTSLLQHLGCTAYAHEAAQVWGDDVASVRLAFLTDFSAPSDIWRTWVSGLSDASGRSRARVLATTAGAGRKVSAVAPVATCEVARDASRRLGLPESVQTSLFHAVASWDGTGYPPKAGEGLPLSTRVTHVASTAVLFALHAGDEAAALAVRRRTGKLLDPHLCEVFLRRSAELLEGLNEVDAYEMVLDIEPDPVRLVDEGGSQEVAQTFGDLVDLKSPWLHGHSAAVAGLAAAAVGDLGLAEQVPTVRLAGHLHDVGRAGVTSRIWDKTGPLSRTERDQARLHAYQSELVLSRVPALAEVAALAGQHHERCDGSGYHRGVTASRLTMSSRVLAAADAFQTLVEGRPHRAALPPLQAADHLRGDVRSGGLDGDAVEAVLRVSGLRAGARPRGPAGLTDRQVEVLGLVARGMSNREIADQLGISSRTAEHHVQDIYLRIGASTRAAAALFAMEHGLLPAHG